MRLLSMLRSLGLFSSSLAIAATSCHRTDPHPVPSLVASSGLASHPRAELSTDPELAAAQRAAIDKLSEFRKLLTSADPAVQDPQVQSIVREGPLIEAVWLLEVRAIPGGFEGTVNAQPQVLKALQRGQRIQVADQDVLDWSYYSRGKPEGGETRLILARQSRRAELADALPKCGEKRFADGCAVLGDGYRSGFVGEKQLDVALSLYVRACAGGSAYGCNAAGWATLHGRGGPRDLPAAAEFFARACVTGEEHPLGCDSRGFALLSGLAGTKRDLKRSFRLLAKACSSGLSPSCLLLELAKTKGLLRGAKLDLACDVNFSEHVSRCNSEEDPESCFLAGSAIETGLCGVPKSQKRARELLRRAAAFGATWPGMERLAIKEPD